MLIPHEREMFTGECDKAWNDEVDIDLFFCDTFRSPAAIGAPFKRTAHHCCPRNLCAQDVDIQKRGYTG